MYSCQVTSHLLVSGGQTSIMPPLKGPAYLKHSGAVALHIALFVLVAWRNERQKEVKSWRSTEGGERRGRGLLQPGPRERKGGGASCSLDQGGEEEKGAGHLKPAPRERKKWAGPLEACTEEGKKKRGRGLPKPAPRRERRKGGGASRSLHRGGKEEKGAGPSEACTEMCLASRKTDHRAKAPQSESDARKKPPSSRSGRFRETLGVSHFKEHDYRLVFFWSLVLGVLSWESRLRRTAGRDNGRTVFLRLDQQLT
ncbi:hypothetical protein EYF80_041090 [Liparis tanakae]|uniref:Uncharacterized protein n=1 Tax=Liparis tanakae TaxID=230148 RepID=A0A4Z2G7Z5_9TELE|nr:hypothetical protein EYF80_041090 [Liparis tanakae]